ncbi:glycerate kinase [Terrimonas sp. NA20]|uniref:Glycerate kinase n=1 Tax=Terrimonas ginsenosidimutans TaxID=2908004 RepID=A0ABS9KUU8_9BACT|nr:glycerate kinase [Terrimonas ginsenosidimutans]MCG2616111.1 glycerate kinase [Terrimonas ginsenosidimutans]
MKIIIAPDKFKGSLTSEDVCKAIEEGIVSVREEALEILRFPMADGGDGFNIVLQHYFHTETIEVDTVDPLGRPIKAPYQWNAETKVAIIEMATASGLVLLEPEERNPLHTSTYGTGLLLKDALTRGATRVILGLGGSATNDAGIGILSALGFSFISETGKELEPTGGNLSLVHSIVSPDRLPEISFQIAADVENPLYGAKGAAYVYGPQKGADQEMVKQLDNGLRNFAQLIEARRSVDIASFPGAGAAGGIAAGLSAFFKLDMSKGVELVLQANKLEDELHNADLLITGEGRIDDQSGSGKVVGTIASLAKKYKIPCIAFCGLLEASKEELEDLGVTEAFAIAAPDRSAEENMKNGYTLLKATVIQYFGESFKFKQPNK